MAIPHSSPTISSSILNQLQLLFESKILQSEDVYDETAQQFCKKFNLDNIYFTQSGTHALYWLLRGFNFKSHDEIILPTYVCPSIYQAVLSVGAKPVLCDTGDYWHMSRQSVSQKITKRTKAIIVVNLFGMALNCTEFDFPNILILNDLCQSFDHLTYPNFNHGDAVFFSFGPTKYITAGLGGAFSLIKKNIQFNNLLLDKFLGSPLSTLNLTLLQQQIKDYDFFVTRRKEIADSYSNQLSKSLTQNISLQYNAFYRYPLIQNFEQFESIQKKFNKQFISVRRGVDQLIHRGLGMSDDLFPNAVKSFNNTLSIPLYPSLNDKEVERIIITTKKIME